MTKLAVSAAGTQNFCAIFQSFMSFFYHASLIWAQYQPNSGVWVRGMCWEMTQRAETRVLRLGVACQAMPRLFGTIFSKFQGFLATVDVHSGLRQEKTQPADSAAETQYFRPFSKHLWACLSCQPGLSWKWAKFWSVGILALWILTVDYGKKRPSQPTQLLRPGILGHFPNTYKPVYHGSLVWAGNEPNSGVWVF